MLIKFDEVCKKHNLRYYLFGGTLLGAIRHKGFIPWDDDIDVAMPRKDYEEFLKIGKAEFAEPYFLQTPYTDNGCYYSFAKLRNSNTSAISYAFRFEKFNQGIFLDIFPLDNCIPEDAQQRYDKIKELNIDNSTGMRMSNPTPNEEEKQRMSTHSGRNPIDVYEEIQEISQQYNVVETEWVNVAVLSMFTYDKLMYKKKCYADVVYAEFEGRKFSIPKNYDELLKRQYGDYMVFPPKEQRGNWHNSVDFEPDIPYSEYIKSIR